MSESKRPTNINFDGLWAIPVTALVAGLFIFPIKGCNYKLEQWRLTDATAKAMNDRGYEQVETYAGRDYLGKRWERVKDWEPSP